MSTRQPMQPVYTDKNGHQRFQENKIVRYLLDNGGIGLNQIASLKFPREDQEQFVQLIGYSLSGYSELGYVSDESYSAAVAMSSKVDKDEKDARIEALEQVVRELREGINKVYDAVSAIHREE